MFYICCIFSVLHQNSAKMHSCTFVISLFFLEKKEWNLNCFHFFREMKSEIIFLFTLFEKWKVNWFLISLFSRSESEIEKPRDRDREVKYEKNSREFSRNETLAGCWSRVGKTIFISVVIAKFLYYFPQRIYLPFWFWYMCHWDISFPIFCDIIRPIFGHLPSHFLDAAASLASTG